jgi:thiol:disulfide interchange protein
LYVLQYILLGALEGAAIDVLSAVGAVTAHNKDKKIIAKHMTVIIILLNLLFLTAGLALYQNIFSLFPIAGAVLQTSAFWMTSERRIRRVSFLGTPFWLAYNLASRAYGSAIGSLLSMFSIGLAIYRYDIYPKRKN